MTTILESTPFGGPVMLDFVDASDPEICCTQSGYKHGGSILTVAPHPRGKNRSSPSALSSFKIQCYWVDRDASEVRSFRNTVKFSWQLESVDDFVRKLGNFKLKPYFPNASYKNEIEIRFLCLDCEGTSNEPLETLKSLKCLTSHSLTQGQEVFTFYAPFGVNEFMNSCSRGCLSNKVGEGVYLVDGRLAPGCEGAPVYTLNNKKYELFGMVVFSIAAEGEHSGYSVVVALDKVCGAVFKVEQPERCLAHPRWNNPRWTNVAFENAIKNIVKVEIPGSWASGVVVGRGLVITNSHVIRFGKADSVNVRWENELIPAKVLFHTKEIDFIDVAVLQYDISLGPNGIEMAENGPQLGERVFAIGYPLLTIGGGPSISGGIIFNHWPGSIGFGSSCFINAGSSGCAIVREDGSLLGLVVGLCQANKKSYSEMNVNLSVTGFKGPLTEFQKAGDISKLNGILRKNDIWLESVMSLPKCKY